MKFTETVQQKMQEENISVRELSRRMDRSHVYVGDLIAGHRRWNETTINEACTALNIAISFDEKKAEEA